MPQEGTSIPLQRVTSLRRRAQANEFAARPMVASCIAAAPSEAMSTSPSRRTCKGCRPSGAKPAMHQFLVSCCACCLRASYNARVSVCLFVCLSVSVCHNSPVGVLSNVLDRAAFWHGRWCHILLLQGNSGAARGGRGTPPPEIRFRRKFMAAPLS